LPSPAETEAPERLLATGRGAAVGSAVEGEGRGPLEGAATKAKPPTACTGTQAPPGRGGDGSARPRAARRSITRAVGITPARLRSGRRSRKPASRAPRSAPRAATPRRR